MQSGQELVAVVIEDDPDVRDLIEAVLGQSGFTTVVADNGFDGVEAVRRHQPLLTTLDVNMPGMDGFTVACRLREFSSNYLIMITALAGEHDVVRGFDVGADDYLVKPFRPRELRARVDSMLRRPRARLEVAAPTSAPPGAAPLDDAPLDDEQPPVEQPAPRHRMFQPAPPPPEIAAVHSHAVQRAHPDAPTPESVQPSALAAPPAFVGLEFNGLALDHETRQVSVDERPVELTGLEFDLLATLLRTGRRVRSKADLALTMRGHQYVTSYFVNEADKRAVEVHISNLRRKLGDDEEHPRYIETVRGVGYRLAEAG